MARGTGKSSKALALQAAIITSIVGPILVAAFTYVFQPRAVQKAKESVSALTIPDERIREIITSTVVVQRGRRGTTGYIVTPRYAVTASVIAEYAGDTVWVIRGAGGLAERVDTAVVAYLDGRSGVAIIDLGRELRDDLVLDARRGEVRVLDKIFAAGYAHGRFVAVREGRVADDDTRDQEGRRVIAVDLPIEPGMAGSPVFDKDANVIGMALTKYEGSYVGYVVPQQWIEYLLEELRGAG